MVAFGLWLVGLLVKQLQVHFIPKFVSGLGRTRCTEVGQSGNEGSVGRRSTYCRRSTGGWSDLSYRDCPVAVLEVWVHSVKSATYVFSKWTRRTRAWKLVLRLTWKREVAGSCNPKIWLWAGLLDFPPFSLNHQSALILVSFYLLLNISFELLYGSCFGVYAVPYCGFYVRDLRCLFWYFLFEDLVNRHVAGWDFYSALYSSVWLSIGEENT